MKLYFYIILLVLLSTSNIFGQEGDTNCSYLFNGFDETLNRNRVETQTSKLIEYFGRKKSNQYARNSIPTIDVSMSKIGSSQFLHLQILLSGKSSNNKSILEKSKLILRFITGERIILLAINNVSVQKSSKRVSKLSSIYHIPDDALNIIKNKDLDLITIDWINGDQTYETYQLDVLRNLYSCIN